MRKTNSLSPLIKTKIALSNYETSLSRFYNNQLESIKKLSFDEQAANKNYRIQNTIKENIELDNAQYRAKLKRGNSVILDEKVIKNNSLISRFKELEINIVGNNDQRAGLNVANKYTHIVWEKSYEDKRKNIESILESLIKEKKCKEIMHYDIHLKIQRNKDNIYFLKKDITKNEIDLSSTSKKNNLEKANFRKNNVFPANSKFVDDSLRRQSESRQSSFQVTPKDDLNHHRTNSKFVSEINKIEIESLSIQDQKEELSKKITQLKNQIKQKKLELKTIIDKLSLHYHDKLIQGIDSRVHGLSWLVLAIWNLGKDVLMSCIPNFLDEKGIEHLFKLILL